jgi:hypothetical protein
MYLGDFRLGDTLDFEFTSRRFSTGAPYALAGSPALAAYPGNSTTQITAGITLTADHDGVTGKNHVRIVASTGNGYATATNYAITLSAGTVDSVSVVGEVVAHFSIENRLLAPNAINRAALAADTGLQSLRSGTAQGGGAAYIDLDTGASSSDDYYNGAQVVLTGGLGAGQYAICTDYTGSSRRVTVDANWVTNPDSTTTFALFPAAATPAEIVTAVWAAATRTLTSLDEDFTTIDIDNSVWGGGTRTLTAATNITSTGGTTVPQTGDSYARLGAPAGASISVDVAAVKTDSGNLITRLGTPSNLGGGATVAANLSDIEAQTDDIGVAGAGLTALATQASVTVIDDFLDTEIAAIKAKTDSLTFTTANVVDANVRRINTVQVDGAGTVGDPWGPV